MTTMTINPENWIDEAAEITIKGNTVEVNGETLELVEELPFFVEVSITKFDSRTLTVMWNGQPLCRMIRLGDSASWISEKSDIARGHDNPYVLAAIMACNFIC